MNNLQVRMVGIGKPSRNQHDERHTGHCRFKRKTHYHRDSWTDLLSNLGCIGEQLIFKDLIESYFENFINIKRLAGVLADDCQEGPSLPIYMELIFVSSFGEPMRPYAPAGPKESANAGAVSTSSADQTQRFQSKLFNNLPDQIRVEMAFS